MTAPPEIPRVGSLFTGYGGLDRAVTAALGGAVAWHCEIEPAPVKVLAYHYPDVPNLGDITQVDWSQVEPVDLLTGGFPCQDVSSAGQGLGLRPGTRSGLWLHMAYAIDQLRPPLVVIENVRGLLSADAHSDLELCPWCLGDNEGRPLRALGAVLGDLADLGYDARWGGLRAADVGAPHGRYRIFITAWPAADPGGGELQRRRVGGVMAGAERAGTGERDQRERDRVAVGDGCADAERILGGPPCRCRDCTAPHTPVQGRGRLIAVDVTRDGATTVRAGETEPGRRDRDAAADPMRDGREGHPDRVLRAATGQPAPLGGDAAGRVLDWGAYEPAIRRWELILGRPAPAPTQTGVRGGQQLSPVFVEWMMGLPAGWVTAVPGITRNEQLKMLGNGVCPQQAEAAVRWLLDTHLPETGVVAS